LFILKEILKTKNSGLKEDFQQKEEFIQKLRINFLV